MIAPLDLIVQGATLISAPGEVVDIGVRDGRIAFVGEARRVGGQRLIDARGLHALPGVVDAHVHLRDPGMPEKEDFGSGTIGAAFGGVTTVVDMPNTDPPPTDAEGFRAKVATVAPRAYVDFALTALLSAQKAETVSDLAQAGAIGFNVFNGVSVFSVPPPANGDLLRLMTAVAGTRLPLGLLPENQDLVQVASRPSDDVDAWLDARTDLAEVQAIASYLPMAAVTRCRAHINHLSSRDGLALIADYRRRGVAVTSETSPHQLLLTRDEIRRYSPINRITPPLRTAQDCAALWAGLKSGDVDIIVSDHAPHSLGDAMRPDLWDPPVTGFAGIEITLPLMIDSALAGRIPLEHVVAAMSTRPARLFGIYPQKGSLRLGSDADLVLVDLAETRVIDPDALHTRGRLTPFAGTRVTGWPKYTLLRGQILVAEGVLATQERLGRFIRPARETVQRW